MVNEEYLKNYFEFIAERLVISEEYRFDYNVKCIKDVNIFVVTIEVFNVEWEGNVTLGATLDISSFCDMFKSSISLAINHFMESHLNTLSYGEFVKVDIKIKPYMGSQSTIIKEERDMYMPEVKEIIHKKSKKKGEVFTVKWTDNTETSVKLMEGDTSDEYVAFMYCMSIKMFGSKGACRQYIKDKKQVFEERVERRSEEIRQRKLKRVAEDKAKREVPYAGGLRVPALCQSSMFKKNGGGGQDKQWQ